MEKVLAMRRRTVVWLAVMIFCCFAQQAIADADLGTLEKDITSIGGFFLDIILLKWVCKIMAAVLLIGAAVNFGKNWGVALGLAGGGIFLMFLRKIITGAF